MPIGFLVPAFLIGLIAIGVPLLLHLRRRDRHQPVPFPSLMFLAQMPIRTERRRRITDWPLLLLRVLAVALLVAAFARPFLRRGAVADAGAAGLTVILLDRSGSMAATGVAEAWQRSADSVIDATPPGRRVAVIAFDTEVRVLSSPSTDRAVAHAAVEQAPGAAGGTRLGAGFRAAAMLLAGERVPGDIVVVSDMQRSAQSALPPPALPAGTTVRRVALTPTSRDNTALIGVEVEPVAEAELRRAVIAARLVRHGGLAPVEREVTLTIDGRDRGRRTVTVPAEGVVRVVFDTVTFSRAAARVELWTDADGLPSDDRYVAVIPGEVAERVLLVVPRDIRAEETRFIEQAIAIGVDPRFVVERTMAPTSAALERSQVVVLYDVTVPDRVGLAPWLGNGGGVLVIAGDRLAGAGTDLPGLLTATHRSRDRRDGAVIGGIAATHPALAALREAGASGLSSLHVRRYAVVDPAPGATVLARYDDGAPALIAAAIGAGRGLVNTIPMTVGAGDFPLQPTFLPFLRGALSWLAGADRSRLAWSNAEPWPVPAALRSTVIKGPRGDLLRPPATARLITLRTAGFHEVYGGDAGGVPEAVVAVNDPAAEADLTAMRDDEMVLGVAADVPPAASLTPVEIATTREASQSGWRWVLLALWAALTLEVVIASRGWRGVPARSVTSSDNEGVHR
jgi:hypothetical protein